jgi:hypothetical protein
MWLAFAAVAMLAACTKLNLGGGSGPIPKPTTAPTATPSTSPSPNVCGTPDANPNLVLVAMGNVIGPTPAPPPYGAINGYAVVENDQFPGQAMLINQWLNQAGQIVPITSQNVLQFTNVDTAGASHSAVGFKGEAFPAVPYAFPQPAASPTGSAVSTKTLWSTGRVAPSVSQQCYSQTFALTPGVYYFGDLDYYNLSNSRDVLIVATPSPARAR